MKRFQKVLAVILCFTLLTTSFAVFVPSFRIDANALTYRTGANSAHSSYKGSRFYENFQKLELTGDGRTDVVAVALSQLGYQESSTAYDFDGEGSGSGNNTEYCYNMGDYGEGYAYYWCATLVSWALYQARCSDQISYSDWIRNHVGDEDYIWCEVSCTQWSNQLKKFGYFKSSAAAGGSYVPQSGDLVFFAWNGVTSAENNHIGIVVYSDGTNVYTVEGNTSSQNELDADGNGVYFKTYDLDYNCITGYGVLPYKTNDSVKKLDYSGANPTPGYYMCNASKYVYPTEDATSSSVYTLRYSMFEVTEVASNGRLKAKGITTTTGETVEGYIDNTLEKARVIQITSSKETPADNLKNIINTAKSANANHYADEDFAALESLIDEAEALVSDESATDAQINEMIEKLEKAINNKNVVELKRENNPDDYTFPTRDLYYNSTSLMTGDDVKWIQAMLINLGYDVTIDGSYGPATKTAVTQFQTDNGLTADGSCGPASRAKLKELYDEMDFSSANVKLNATVSDTENGAAVTTVTEGDTIYLNYTLTDADSNKALNTLIEKNYSVTLTLTNPDGTVLKTETLTNADSGSISATATQAGEVNATVSVTGDFEFDFESTVTVEEVISDDSSDDVSDEVSDDVSDDTSDDSSDDTSDDSSDDSSDDESDDSSDDVSDDASDDTSDEPTDPEIPVEPEYSLGDIDNDEALTISDYIFVKRAYMGTYALSDVQFLAADIDKDEVITISDYIFVKRAYMGTYQITQ